MDRKTNHSKVNAFVILKRVEQSHQPFTLGVCKNITLGENMPDFIKLKKEFLAHDLQRANLPSILLLCEENLSISTLSNLSKNLKVTLAKTNSAFSQVGTFSTCIFLEYFIVGIFVCLWRCGELSLELIESILSCADVCE
jgi:hypothetical protein